LIIDLLLYFFRKSGAIHSGGTPELKIEIKEILQVAHNALSISPLLLLVGKSAVWAHISKDTLISVSTFSSFSISSDLVFFQYAASLGTKPTALLTVEQLVWQCICRVANGGDAAVEIVKLGKEYHSLMKDDERRIEAIAKQDWFSECEIFFCHLIGSQI